MNCRHWRFRCADHIVSLGESAGTKAPRGSLGRKNLDRLPRLLYVLRVLAAGGINALTHRLYCALWLNLDRRKCPPVD
jgi:hypothetical protein